MNLLMLSGDRALAAGERGPFHAMLKVFSQHWDRIDIICPKPSATRVEVVHGNVWLHPSRLGRWLQPAHIAACATRLARQRRYDLMVSHDYGLFYNALGAHLLHRRLGLPWVSEIHHVDGHPRAAGLYQRGLKLAAYGHVRGAARRAAAFRVVCRQIGALLDRWGVEPAKIALLPSLYLDLDLFSPSPEHPKDVDVLCCARLESEKGLSLLVQALRLLKRRTPAIRARIIGRGRLGEPLKRQLREYDLERHVDLVDWLDGPEAMVAAYRGARTLVCTSFSEGNPRVVGEAMACGVAVVSTPVGIVPEIVVDGENGMLVDWNAEHLAEKVAQLLEDDALRRKIGEAAPRAVRGFEAQQLIGRLAEAYQRIAAATAP